MSPEAIGVLAGGIFGLANFGLFRWIADRMEGMSPTPEQRRTAGIMRMVAWVDMIVFPVMGYFIVPMVME